jgi:hypothetical protein
MPAGRALVERKVAGVPEEQVAGDLLGVGAQAAAELFGVDDALRDQQDAELDAAVLLALQRPAQLPLADELAPQQLLPELLARIARGAVLQRPVLEGQQLADRAALDVEHPGLVACDDPEQQIVERHRVEITAEGGTSASDGAFGRRQVRHRCNGHARYFGNVRAKRVRPRKGLRRRRFTTAAVARDSGFPEKAPRSGQLGVQRPRRFQQLDGLCRRHAPCLVGRRGRVMTRTVSLVKVALGGLWCRLAGWAQRADLLGGSAHPLRSRL